MKPTKKKPTSSGKIYRPDRYSSDIISLVGITYSDVALEMRRAGVAKWRDKATEVGFHSGPKITSAMLRAGIKELRKIITQEFQ